MVLGIANTKVLGVHSQKVPWLYLITYLITRFHWPPCALPLTQGQLFLFSEIDWIWNNGYRRCQESVCCPPMYLRCNWRKLTVSINSNLIKLNLVSVGTAWICFEIRAKWNERTGFTACTSGTWGDRDSVIDTVPFQQPIKTHNYCLFHFSKFESKSVIG